MKEIIKRSLLLFSVLILFCSTLAAQENDDIKKTHSIKLKTQFVQFKDDFTYNLAFSGINLMAAYAFNRESKERLMIIHSEIGFGASFNKGAGLAWRFKPLDLFYGYKTQLLPFTIGAYLAADYQWQQYSELQGGRLFWFSTIEAGPEVRYNLPLGPRTIAITFSNSLFGLSSRPAPSTERYFYSFNFSEFISSAHENLKFGSYNIFNRTLLEIEWLRPAQKRFSLAYQFEYFAYYRSPMVNFLNHSLSLNMKIGKL